VDRRVEGAPRLVRRHGGEAPDGPAIEPVRVHHLLSQMSGLTYGFTTPTRPTRSIDRRVTTSDSPPCRSRPGRARLVFEPLVFQPGSGWNYSVSVDVLGRLIEIWSGQSFESFLQDRVLDHSAWSTPTVLPEEKWDRLAMLYVPSKGDSFPTRNWPRERRTRRESTAAAAVWSRAPATTTAS